MSIEKSEIKQGTLKEQIEAAEAKRDRFDREINELGGAASALKKAASGMGGLVAYIQKDLTEEKLELPETPQALAKVLILWISRARELCNGMADQRTATGLLTQGRKQGVEEVLGDLIKAHDAEGAKAAGLKAGENGTPDGTRPGQRPPGSKPGLSIADERKAREAADKALKDAKDAKPPKGPRKRRRKSGGSSPGKDAPN